MGKFSNFIKIFLYGEDYLKNDIKDKESQTNSSKKQTNFSHHLFRKPLTISIISDFALSKSSLVIE